MGHQVGAKCLDCGRTFKVDHGGGFSFHLVRCETCGKTKSMAFDVLGELHVRYVKGLPGPYSTATVEQDENLREHSPVQPISEPEYHKEIEALAGRCRCGGRYRLDAPPRCPKCRSARIEEGRITTMYD
jgi:hypothetical protein